MFSLLSSMEQIQIYFLMAVILWVKKYRTGRKTQTHQLLNLIMSFPSPAVLAGAGSQGAACQGVKVGRVTQSPGGHGEALAGGGGTQTTDCPVQTAVSEARGLEGSPRICHCRIRSRIFFIAHAKTVQFEDLVNNILFLHLAGNCKVLSVWCPHLWLDHRPHQSQSVHLVPSLCWRHNLLLDTEKWAPHRTRRPTWWAHRYLKRDQKRNSFTPVLFEC